MALKGSKPSDRLVLIVEDDQGMREYMEHVASSEGFRCAGAGDGLLAVKMIRELTPDVALVDLMLPRCGGYELLRELHKGAPVPLIVVTARYAGERDRAEISRMPNVAAFLQKPVAAEVLVNALHEILGTART